jgi:acyl-CoA reductase-like NAD-dependent aldehyde dehydrogenase/nicotinamidase-related amidase
MSERGSTGLLLVDLQHDFLRRPGLAPDQQTLCQRAATLLDGCRALGLPVAHVHTVIGSDGADRMPHWIADGRLACVEGTEGVEPPAALAPSAGELVARKRFYSGFADAALDAWLRDQAVARLVVAGVYTHGCVRQAVLDAYERGYEVWVADDAVATTEPVHGILSREWLAARAARFRPVDDILRELCGDRCPAPRRFVHRDPCRRDTVLAEVPLGGPAEVRAAADAAAAAHAAWGRMPVAERAQLLHRWAETLTAGAARLTALVVEEVGKPVQAAQEEIARAVAHVRSAAALLDSHGTARPLARDVAVCHRPVGVVGLVLPWNNPVALPVGKIAPALAFGNGVVFKPAPEATRTALAVRDSLAEASAPVDLVHVVLGDHVAAEAMCDDPRVDVVSVTGSVATGRALAARCGARGKPIQAELGGNNAAIVLPDVDLERVVPELLRAAFAFAGQRCTAIRRFVVDATIAPRFEAIARAAIREIVVGDPRDPATLVGPLISERARARVQGVVERARAEGARLVAKGTVSANLGHGSWLAPALLADVDSQRAIAQEETFGPVAVMFETHDLDEAIAVANRVVHGLVLAVCTEDLAARAWVLETARAGIVQLGAGPLGVHPDAPFGGWKASGMGPPEHGEWDAAFFSRVQAVYGAPPW